MTAPTAATKTFSLGALLSVTTGYMLVKSFGDVHEVFDHLYPGIMTLGIAMMSDAASKAVIAQHPALAGVRPPPLGGLVGEAALGVIGPWLTSLEAEHGAELTLVQIPEVLRGPEAYPDLPGGAR